MLHAGSLCRTNTSSPFSSRSARVLIPPATLATSFERGHEARGARGLVVERTARARLHRAKLISARALALR